MLVGLQILALGVTVTAAAIVLAVLSARVWFEPESHAVALAAFIPLAFAGAFGPTLAALFAAQFVLAGQTPGAAAKILLVLTVIIPPPAYLWVRHICFRRYRRETHSRQNTWGR
ncbi:MAG: hypothetical protein JJU18_04420 [Oceanicaulis sp.]|nr:hypothetical protein [Oceanicaulis sp.]